MDSPRVVETRLCPACGTAEAIPAEAPIWPAGWRCARCGTAIPFADGIAHLAPALADSLTGFDPAAYEGLARGEDGHFWFEPRSRLLVALAGRFFPEARRYMEIGCGTGAVLKPMAASRAWSRVVGSEIHPTGLGYARRRLGERAEFVQMDARHIPVRAAFDLIGAFDVLEHIAEDEAVLGEVREALAPGGGFLVAVPQHPWLWSEVDEISYHVRRYRRGEMEARLRKAGFEILHSTSFAATVLPLMAVDRLRRRRARSPGAPRREEVAVHPALNAVLLRLMQAEVWLTLKGLRWPAGGSRVVVTRKAM